MSAAIISLVLILLVLIALAGCYKPQTRQPEWTRCKVLADKQDHPNGIAVDDKFVYYSTGGMLSSQQEGTNNIRRVSIAGGEATVLASGGGDWLPSGGIALDERFVYFTAFDRVLRVPKEGGAVETVATGVAGVNYLAASGDRLYLLSFIHRDTPVPIRSVPKNGGKVEIVVENQLGANDLQVDGDFIYWMTPGGVMRARKDGSEQTKIYSADKGYTARLLVDAGNLYFTQGEGRQALMKLAKTGGAAVQLAPSINHVHHLVADDSSIYYFDNEKTGSALGGLALRKVSKDGSSPVTLDTGEGGWIDDIAAGRADIFFRGIGEIYSIPK